MEICDCLLGLHFFSVNLHFIHSFSQPGADPQIELHVNIWAMSKKVDRVALHSIGFFVISKSDRSIVSDRKYMQFLRIIILLLLKVMVI